MKVLIVFTSLLAISFAGYYPQHHYPINIPVIGHTGVPLEPAEVVHARQAHLSHVHAVRSHQGAGGYYGGHDGAYAGGYAGLGGAGHYGGHYAVPIIGHGGVPIDTPEVQAAKAAHFAAHAKAAAAASYGGHGHYRRRRGIYGGYAVPVIGHNGVPLDTPEVQAAKAEHFAAHAKAGSGLGHGYGAGYGAAGHGAYLGGPSYEAHTYPQLAHNGQPIETPEVQALKHAHFAAHAEALSRVGGGYHNAGAYAGHGAGAYAGHGAASSYANQHLGGAGYAGHGAASHGAYHGPIHIPVIGHNGVPLETPEVAHAKQAHFAALAEASARAGAHGHHGSSYDGHY
ncbi:cuticle protein 18.7-like [Chrysoperla carnea]|uniref:cuticle protein 18.7-like n=1 Tax=Chrysoperla carnea TaxID=189513 RepID=UPI001D0976B2|nr:cuticle protein 18.7-like [Chrysoperla carnea]